MAQPKCSLEEQTWTCVQVSSRPCLLKGVFAGEGYEILLWDMGYMWREMLAEEGVMERMAVSPYFATC